VLLLLLLLLLLLGGWVRSRSVSAFGCPLIGYDWPTGLYRFCFLPYVPVCDEGEEDVEYSMKSTIGHG